jgi:large subunit ribosomal protein L22
MGARKRNMADRLKEERKSLAYAKLNDCPTSPRKMRLVADMVRGAGVNRAMDLLRFSKKEASIRLEKLIKSAVYNWEAKNEGSNTDDADLYVKEIFVNQGRTLKRIRTAPQGRAARIRKRSNHVTVILGSKTEEKQALTEEGVE